MKDLFEIKISEFYCCPIWEARFHEQVKEADKILTSGLSVILRRFWPLNRIQNWAL